MRIKKSEVSGNERKLIMVVDTDKSILSGLEENLAKDFDVIGMDNGPDALRYINEVKEPDAVVLDMEMPKLNGRVFVRRIKFDPRHNKIPVILISLVDSRLIINSFLKLGVVDYVIKPFDPSDLAVKIKKIVRPDKS